MINDNSIWPNGMQTDEEGYAVFYPMGTNKVDIPKNSPHWPKGSKLIGSFVYDKNNKLVGFCDTKAMTTSTNNGEIIVMPYEHIEADFDSIEKNGVQIHAPKATYKKASWNGSVEKEDIPDIDYKYKGCKYVSDIKTVDENYLENDIKDGCWTELLSSNITGHDMFNGCETLMSFKSDLSSLDYGINTFRDCINLTSFEADLSLLNNGNSMFGGCTNLSNFESNLDSLSFGLGMFNNCSSLTSFKCDLSSLTNGQQMFQGCSKLMTFTSDLSSLTIAYFMFSGCSNLTTFTSDLNSLTDGRSMFDGCSNLSSFTVDLSSVTNSGFMFGNCVNLVTFNSKLNSLNNGNQMFYNCKKLSNFKSNLSSLEIAQSMFLSCSNLSSFKIDLKRVTDGASMFNGCKNLTHFKSNLGSLIIGQNMFHSCSSLTKFDCSDLSSLTGATNMFHQCKLDVPSIKNIIEIINTVETGEITIGMGCDNNQTDKDLFAQEAGYSDMTTLIQALQNKGWTVSAQFNGRPSTNYSLRQPESLPVYVKLVEIIPTEENSFYEYTSQDGSKFYNLDWFHETTGSTDGYTQFNSLEEAITTFNIKPIEK
jgi:hypothetical protein